MGINQHLLRFLNPERYISTLIWKYCRWNSITLKKAVLKNLVMCVPFSCRANKTIMWNRVNNSTLVSYLQITALPNAPIAQKVMNDVSCTHIGKGSRLTFQNCLQRSEVFCLFVYLKYVPSWMPERNCYCNPRYQFASCRILPYDPCFVSFYIFIIPNPSGIISA